MPELVPRQPGPTGVAEEREVWDQLSQAIETLPEHQRVAVTLHYLNGYWQAEISSFLEIPVGTVKSRHTWRERS